MHSKFRTSIDPTSDSSSGDDDDIQQLGRYLSRDFQLKEKKLTLSDTKNKQNHRSTSTRATGLATSQQPSSSSSRHATGRMINKMAQLFFQDSRTNNPSLGMNSGTNNNTTIDSTGATLTSPDLTNSTGTSTATIATSPLDINPSSQNQIGFDKLLPQSDSELSSDSISIDPLTLKELTEGGTRQMIVQKADTIHSDRNKVYRMHSNPRGPCLIVNNVDFENDIFPTRKGSDEDARRFDEIFQQLGFYVIMRRNQTAKQMKALFKDVASFCKKEHDAVFVFILSHGNERGIYGVDGGEVWVERDMITYFDNRNCISMIGKPKVFVMQACRGSDMDSGGEGDATDAVVSPKSSASSPTPPNNRVPESWLPSLQPIKGQVSKHPMMTDMMLIYSCLPGFVSIRNETAGSWLGVALAYFIMTRAHDNDLIDILLMVTSDIKKRQSSHGYLQSPDIRLIGWHKRLYFNPGHYKTRAETHL